MRDILGRQPLVEVGLELGRGEVGDEAEMRIPEVCGGPREVSGGPRQIGCQSGHAEAAEAPAKELGDHSIPCILGRVA